MMFFMPSPRSYWETTLLVYFCLPHPLSTSTHASVPQAMKTGVSQIPPAARPARSATPTTSSSGQSTNVWSGVKRQPTNGVTKSSSMASVAPSRRTRGAATPTPSGQAKPSHSEDVKETSGQQNALPITRRGRRLGQKPPLNHTTSWPRIDTRRTLVPRNRPLEPTLRLLPKQSFKILAPTTLLSSSYGAKTLSLRFAVGGSRYYSTSWTETIFRCLQGGEACRRLEG